MGFLDKFKSEKAQEIQDTQGVKATPAKADAKKPATDAKAPAAAKKAAEEPKQELPKIDRRIHGRLATVIERPLVTEKAARLAGDGQYMFAVRKDAGRVEVSQAIRAMYGISPTSVNIQNVHGKRMRFGRMSGKRSSWKKAIVTLPKGKTIDVYEGV